MPIPALITQGVTVLQADIADSSPLASASVGTLAALSTTADQFVTDVQSALLNAAGGLDTFMAPYMAPAIVAGYLTVVDAANTQLALADLRGFAGRLADNLTNG